MSLLIAGLFVVTSGAAAAESAKLVPPVPYCSWRNPGRCVRRAAEAAVTVVTAPADVVTGQPIGTTAENIVREGERAVDNTVAESERTVENVGEAIGAIGGYVEAQAKGTADMLGDAERRVREGKIADAFWHMAVDPIATQEEAAAAAVQQSSILNAAAQAGATAYGGPGGAAAYASWFTYRATNGDAEAALRAGMIAGATSASLAAVGDMPSDTASQLTIKSITAGSVGGLAVAAAGGDEDAVLEGFLRGGGMILVQDGYRAATGGDLDARGSVGEPYCMATIGAECSPNFDAYVLDENGAIVLRDGKPLVDVTRTDFRRPHVGTWSEAGDASFPGEGSPGMVAISRVPGMNAMSVFHDQWSVSWDMDPFTNAATIVPAVVLTYTGTGAPLFSEIDQAVIEDSRQEEAEGE